MAEVGQVQIGGQVQQAMGQVGQAAQPVVQKFKDATGKNYAIIGTLAVAAVLLGIASGWGLSGKRSSGVAPGASQTVTEAGLADEKTFRDTATGNLEEGGIVGEGTHHLVRDGGPSQNVYLTSTVIDLASFVGKKVQVWGETISGKKAGWLMDVGKIKVVQ